MAPIFNFHADEGDRPIKEEIDLHEMLDENGKPVVDPVRGRSVRLSGAGALQDIRLTRDRVYDGCGCTTANDFGHRCQEPGCYRSVCRLCAPMARCTACLKPLCHQDLNSLIINSQRVGLCPGCYATTKRKQLLTQCRRKFKIGKDVGTRLESEDQRR